MLKVGKDFSTWIKDRIEQYDFVENQDFVIGSPISGNQSGRGGDRRSKEYFVTIDMAKELSMVERTEEGKRARLYFIECERRARAGATDPVAVLNDPAAMRGLLLTYSEKVLALQAEVGELTPKAEALDRLADADGSHCITDAAKLLQVRPKALFDYLSSNGWTYRRVGADHWCAYQARIISRDLVHKVTTVLRPDGSEKTGEQVRVTPQGLTKLAKLIGSAVRPVPPSEEAA
ncbi:phage antirepressor KilAC domain-containing protein [Roseomonas sp. NAR14]|uniref:Phage antirepressor KilAC domain-containing protein n=1 Tax=Roseomonas acroporae TaxID=2937791 RepID=A0A9X1YCH8_9PROT|nr:phage antirepressor KilAC domain-containing protein [Roseomonas acroporae]